jgi:1,4-alpha-glucan branching enzyme
MTKLCMERVPCLRKCREMSGANSPISGCFSLTPHFQPGKKLLFMGSEFGQRNEWYHETSLDWHLIQQGNPHNGVQKLVGTLNWLYRTLAPLHEKDAQPSGFRWVDVREAAQSNLSWLRFGANPQDMVLVVCNFTPVPRNNLRLGVPRGGFWKEIFNSDALDYGGSGQGNFGGVNASPFPWHDLSHRLTINLPPLAAVAFKPD